MEFCGRPFVSHIFLNNAHNGDGVCIFQPKIVDNFRKVASKLKQRRKNSLISVFFPTFHFLNAIFMDVPKCNFFLPCNFTFVSLPNLLLRSEFFSAYVFGTILHTVAQGQIDEKLLLNCISVIMREPKMIVLTKDRKLYCDMCWSAKKEIVSFFLAFCSAFDAHHYSSPCNVSSTHGPFIWIQ